MQIKWFGVKYPKWALFLLGLCFSVLSWSQDYSTISGDGRFLATVKYQDRDKVTGQHNFIASVYSVAYKTLIQRFNVRLDKSSSLDSLRLSHTGKMLYIQSKDDYRMYNTRLGNLVFRTDKPMRFAMANQDNFFVVCAPSFIKGFDAYTGEEKIDYRTAANNEVLELTVTPDDEHIAASTDRKQIIFWQVGKERSRKKYFGDDLVFKKNGKGFTVARKMGTQIRIYNYELPTFKRLGKISLTKALREDARDRTLYLRESDPSKRREIIKPSEPIENAYVLSQVGDYVALLAQSPDDEKELYVIQSLSGDVLKREVVGDMKQQIDLDWYNDSLLIPQNTVSPKVYNAKTNSYQKDLKLKFLYRKPKGLFARRKDWDSKNISANFLWAVSEGEDDSFTLSRTEQGQTPKRFPNKRFLGFDKSARFAYAMLPNGDQKFYTDLSKYSKASQVVWYPLGEEQRLYPEPELGPAKPPANYDFVRIQGMRHISEATEQDTLRLIMKTVETGSKAGVQVQIVDQNGIYYYGAGNGEWKNLWCNLMVKGSDGKVKQIDDFTVTEYSDKDSLANAVATVLDFSGSMGWPRADALQDGVERFLKTKKKDDEISIFKYDHRVSEECDLLDREERLIRKLYSSDFSAFGGATALLDATNAGIFSVKKTRQSGRKMVMVLTDGHENSSLITKNEVLKNALENGVHIYTIGFGDKVNQGYLKSLAYNTRGGHYQIYDVADFEWIYEDIYKKSQNYYSINYKTEDKGSMVYLLKICRDGLNTDSVVVEFDNEPADLEVLANTLDDYKDNPVTASGFTEINTAGFTFSNLKNFDKVKTERPLLPKAVKIYEDSLTQIEDEFALIELPQFNFSFDEVSTVKETESRIYDIIKFLEKYPQINLEIIGHTDNSGDTEYNDDLSKRRADRVKDLIVEKGGDPNRLVTQGYGETAPIADNETDEGRAKNRRVEFAVIERK